jgi:two-component system response regulator MprA
MLERSLSAEGFTVETAADGGAALVAAERTAHDVIVLDVAMAGFSGIDVCRRLRSKGVTAAILMLTARDAVVDRVTGLEAGADDYMVKPFAVEELVARIRALLRRAQPSGDLLTYGDLTLDLHARAAVRAGTPLDLTAREIDLLELPMRSPRQVISRETAIAEIWDDTVIANVVDQHIANLRRKLGDPPLIQTVRGIGFTLRR